jgi:hypothetical protein
MHEIPASEDESRGVPETFGEFKDSFYYGRRSDLAFKFLRNLSDGEAAEFFRSLLEKLGDTIDDGDADRLIQHAFTWQVRAYAPRQGAPARWAYADAPFTRLAKPLSESRLALVSSGGHFVAGDDPRPFDVEDMTQEEAMWRIEEFLRAVPELSEIPLDTSPTELRVRHGGYDIRGAVRDPGVILPVSVLEELAVGGRIGELHPEAYSFVGASSQKRLLNEAAPEWAGRLRDQEIDVVLLVPG